MVIFSAATGACFTMLTALSVKAIVAPVRRFHIASVIVALLSVVLAFLAFRAAAFVETDEENLIASWRAAMFTALLALIVTAIFLYMFGDHTRGFLAHAISSTTSTFTPGRVLIGVAVLGFGAGLVTRMNTFRSSKGK